jgi:hypothetical protein
MRRHENGARNSYAPPIDAGIDSAADSAQAGAVLISAGKPVTVTTNGVWEAGGFSAADITDDSLLCDNLSNTSADGTIGWQNNDYGELGVVNVTIGLGGIYSISSISYNQGNCMRANTWVADSITTPLGAFTPLPGTDTIGAWTTQTTTSPIIASTVVLQLNKTRTSWETDWMSIGEIQVWGELLQAGPPPEPRWDGGVDAPVGSPQDGPAGPATGTNPTTNTNSTTATNADAASAKSDESGCGCVLGGSRPARTTMWLMVGLCLLALRSRRSRRS